MPPKLLSQPRAWGTRFDSLVSSDPPPPRSPQTDIYETQEAVEPSTTESAQSELSKPTEQRMPHDASIFVGSLPTDIEQTELSRLLSQHLMDHAEVKSIKIVRDQKGGVCAFVQCEDATSAAHLVYILNNTPIKPFMGRFLRYEPARAFRTLLISYRSPMKYLPDRSPGVSTSTEASHEGTLAPLELPTAMKIWRNRNSRFLSIVYNEEAIALEASHNENDAPKPSGIFLRPVLFDAETVHKIASAFGPLERFAPFCSEKSLQVSSKGEGLQTSGDGPYPIPHNQPRSTSMDDGCWEVKWGYREDAVSALMTLRRVPHLTVTWAHTNPPPENFTSPRSSVFTNAGSIVDASPRTVIAGPDRVSDTVLPQIPLGSIVLPVGEKISLTIQTSNGKTMIRTIPDDLSSNSAANDWVQSPISPSPLGSFPRADQLLMLDDKPDLTDSDFPPLATIKGDRKPSKGFWGDRLLIQNEVGTVDDFKPADVFSVEHSAILTPRATAVHMPSPDQAQAQIQETGPPAVVEDEGQDLDMPPTPDFGLSPNTPTTSTSMKFPQTPASARFEMFASSPSASAIDNFSPSYMRETRESELDPTTIFVGGLEINGPNAWDENRVKEYFSKFGDVEDIKYIVPNTGRSSFAFVKFDNTESSVRAVSQEHNRIHDGRTMRVQLRDLNPPRGSPWKGGRGRGRALDPPRRSLESMHTSHDGSAEILPATHLTPHSEYRSEPIALQQDINDELTTIKYPTLLDQPLIEDVNLVAEDSVSLGEAECVSRTHAREFSSGDSSGYQTCPKKANSPQHEQTWNSNHSSTPPTPTHSSYASSISATAPSVPYMPPNMGYLYPQPWMGPQFGHQMQYGMHYVPGYPGYAMPPQQASQIPSPPGSECSASTGPQSSWGPGAPVYHPYVHYPAYAPAPMQAPSDARAPLMPTGFIQGEHGTLIPLYQPDALDRYMSGGAAQLQSVPPAAQAQIQIQPAAHSTPPAAPWRAFPPGGSYPYLPASQLPAQAQHGGWVPNQAPYMLPLASTNSPARGGHARSGGHNGHGNGHQHLQSSGRRQRQSTYDRGTPSRGNGPLRYQHGGQEQGYADGSHGMPQPAFAAGWNQ